MLLLSSNQVAPQAAKTTSPPFPRIGGFGGGSSNSFEQMPTGASPTTTSGGNYPPINVRAGLNNNGYGRFHPQFPCLPLCVHSLLCPPPPPDGSQSGAQYPPRAAEEVWSQWQGQQQAQNNAEQQPHHQGNQQDMFPVSDSSFRVSPKKDVLSSFSQNNPACFLNVIQDVLSILDQPPNFNNDDFEIYSQFNE